MKKVLYLHGLESKQGGPKVDFLANEFIVHAPKMDYKDSELNIKMFFTMQDFQPDLIIGSSMGGYVGMLLANRYGIKNLLYNPAIHSRSIEPNLNKLLKVGPNHFVDFNIVLGNQDDVIDPNVTESMLLDAEVVCEIERVDMKHRIDFNVFVNMYNKYINYEL